MPRFYIEPASAKDGVVLLSKKESHHAFSVLRLKNGDNVELFDGRGNTFLGVIAGFEDERLSVKLGEKRLGSSSSPVQITLAVSVIKPERMELLIQKACELGVFSIAPLISDRCVVKLSRERWESKIKRWQKIALETCKQCGQSTIPQIQAVQDYKAFVAKVDSFDKILIPTLAVLGGILYSELRESKPGTLLAFIGPEGDFTQDEVALAVSHGAKPVSLGSLVLRSETAAIYLLSSINFFYREIA